MVLKCTDKKCLDSLRTEATWSDEKKSGPTVTVTADFTHLVGKHVAADLVGNNMRVVGEDAVQDGAVILS